MDLNLPCHSIIFLIQTNAHVFLFYLDSKLCALWTLLGSHFLNGAKTRLENSQLETENEWMQTASNNTVSHRAKKNNQIHMPPEAYFAQSESSSDKSKSLKHIEIRETYCCPVQCSFFNPIRLAAIPAGQIPAGVASIFSMAQENSDTVAKLDFRLLCACPLRSVAAEATGNKCKE